MSFKERIIDRVSKFVEKHDEFENEVFYNQLCFILDEYKERDRPPIEIIEKFFSTHQYYYNATTDLYIHYSEYTFKMIHENILLQHILNYLSHHRNDYDLDTYSKNVIKLKIQRQIKQQSIKQCIPESITLQNTLSFFYPNLTNDKCFSKYFLAVLGDILLKKTTCVYFVPIFMKSFLQQLNKYISLYFHSINLFQWFKFKYTDHDPNISRILHLKPLNMLFFNLDEDFFVNMICVSIHYSYRYHSSEEYLNRLSTEWKDDILWLQKETKESMISKFMDAYIIEKPECTMDEKDMLFLWKSYLNKEGKLNIFQKNQELFNLIYPRITFKHNKFINVYSLFLPYVETFKSFWETYIYDDPTEYEFELNELYDLYSSLHKYKMNEVVFKDLIEHYYPHVEFIEGKYIPKMGCKLWDKKADIAEFCREGDINELYKIYCKEFKGARKVSKRYFIQCLPSVIP